MVSTEDACAAAVVVAAGSSTRMARAGVAGRKPLLELDGAPLVEHTLRAFDAARSVREVIVVTHAADVDQLERMVAERPAFAKVRGVVPGGETRADSVRCGVRWCAFDVDVICVHDGARPLIAPATIDAAVALARAEGAALVARAVHDTLKVAGPDESHVESTLDRSRLFAAQTPQAFRARDFRELVERARTEGFRPTDESSLWERYRGPVAVVEGLSTNLKITTPDDLELAASLLASRREEPSVHPGSNRP